MVVLVVCGALCLILLFVGVSLDKSSKGSTRKKDVDEARKAIAKVDDIARRYNSQLDVVGQAMVDEVRQEINNYWRGIKA